MHLLTNAVDHGIESSEERAQKKKPSFGNLKVDIYTIANRLVIQVEDDGRGLDLQKIQDTAVKKKLTTTQLY
jgi:chemotaxis protein histidine kinase CheA